MAKNGVVQGRQCPSIGEYREYQAPRGKIAADEMGGLYWCLFLKKVLAAIISIRAS